MTDKRFLEITAYLAALIKETEFENKVYAVGGAIRSLQMGEDIKDIDLVIELPDGGVKLAEFLKESGHCSNVVIYPTFGTAMFHLNQFPDEEIECVMTRGEKYLDSGSRNPTVTFASLKEDASRRDLTINALYYNISQMLIRDPTCLGLKDIERGVIRTPRNPNETFIDDPLRILRVVRFAERTKFDIIGDVYVAMKENIDRLSIISKERIRDEFIKILLNDNVVKAFDILMDIGAMKYIIPEFVKTKGCTQNEYHFGDVYQHTVSMLDYYHKNMYVGKDLIVLLALVLHDIGKIETRTIKDGKVHFYEHEIVGEKMVEPILRNLKFDNDTIKEVQFLVKNHMRTKNFGNSLEKIKEKSLNKLAYVCGTEERYIRLASVIECDNMCHRADHCVTGQFVAMIAAIPYVERMFGFKLPVNGDDVMQITHCKPCAEIKEVLRRITKTAMGKPDITKSECVQLIRAYWKQVQKEKRNEFGMFKPKGDD